MAAAVVFAVAYLPLLGYNIVRAFQRPTYVLIALALFCAIRVSAFAIRAALAASSTAGENEDLFIAEQILYNAGFFGLLYSAYTLVLDRDQMAGQRDMPGLFGLATRITRNRHLIRIALLVAVVIGINGAIDEISGGTSSKVSTGETLRRASTYVFLAVTILMAFRTFVLALEHGNSPPGYNTEIELGNYTSPISNPAFGARHGIFVLAAISILLLVRDIFYTVTLGSTNASMEAKATNETFFYPLVALPELLAVVLFAVPGLVPSRRELQMYSAKA